MITFVKTVPFFMEYSERRNFKLFCNSRFKYLYFLNSNWD